ncbi:MAG TPA: glycosyltransferase [Atribacterota bacterium]|nr:glycosyltransferase [Atribacterota bacterium]
MRILFIAPMFHTNQMPWVQTLIENNHTVEYWSLCNKMESNVESLKSINIKKIEQPYFNKIGAYYEQLKNFDPDVVVGRNPHLNLFILLFLLISKLQRRKTLIYTQTDLYQVMPFSRKIGVTILLNTIGNYWITPLTGCRVNYPKFHCRAFYIPFIAPVSTQPQRNCNNINNNKINIISVGRINQKRKNVLLLLKALKLIEKNISFHLNLIGHMNKRGQLYEEITEFIKSNDLEDKVTIKENIPYHEMSLEYQKNNLFILPSSSEPAAYSLLEAMAAGLPVICSDTNGTKCYIEEGENGYIFKSNNLEDLTEKIKIITSDKNEMKNMGERSAQIVKEKYNTDSFYKAFEKLIQ